MTQLIKLMTALSATLLVTGCSTFYTPEPEPITTTTTATTTKTKITRGSGYGFEVPYESKHGYSNEPVAS